MILGAPAWLWPSIALGVVALAAILWAYRLPGPSSARPPILRLAMGLKCLGLGLLLFCLTEPLTRQVRARPGANQLLVLVDDSRSLTVLDRDTGQRRADTLRTLVSEDAPWLLRAAQDFDLQRFAFDTRLRSLRAAEELEFAGPESALARTLARLASRSEGRPVAGVMLFSDGVSTDEFGEDFDWRALPPVHVISPGGVPERDLALARLEVSQTNFEAAPVTIRALVASSGCDGRPIAVELCDEEGSVLERQELTASDDEERAVRFHAPTEASGVHAYQVRVAFVGNPSGGELESREATTANNVRWAVVDRGGGAHRVLYVSGRPNWEFKFLRRAMEEDAEIDLVGLLRIARSQPKFAFRAGKDRRNALWEGFENRDEEVGEQVDEPVLLRMGTRDEFELRAGFPDTAEELFAYDALILDDIEAEFFTPDQQTLIEQFVARRGAGFLLLGGEETFLGGGYRRTPLGDLLPVYLDSRGTDGGLRPRQAPGGYALELTREGWLEPWVRLRATEELERERLEGMPRLRTLNRVGDVKPGASVLLEAVALSGSAGAGTRRPALVAQRFGRGRSAAMTMGDFWRWDLQRPEPAESDLGTAWRQMLRWLVADVPRPVELSLDRAEGSREVRMTISLRDAAFEAVHNARLELEVTPPHGEPFLLEAAPSSTEAGRFGAEFVPRAAGPYRARLRALDEDGLELGEDEAGWVSEPDAGEFRRLASDDELLARIAERTGGSVVAPEGLAAFAGDLARREVPITEEELDPIWHRWWVLLLALACLAAEWGLRRFHGLP